MAGEYRELFKEGLQLVMAQDMAKGRTDRLPKCMLYLGMLEREEFKFGRVDAAQRHFAPSELFLLS